MGERILTLKGGVRMSFPAETTDGEIVQIVDKTSEGDLIAEDGSVFSAVANLKVQLKEAGAAVANAADEASEALGEVVEDVKDAAEAVAEDVSDLAEAVEGAVEEVGDVLEAAGDVAEEIGNDPLGAVKDLLGDDEA